MTSDGRPSLRLTKPQREHLVMLLQRGALSLESAAYAPAVLSARTISSLIDKDLACRARINLTPAAAKQLRLASSGQRTVYWLTDFGRAMAQIYSGGLGLKAIRKAMSAAISEAERLA